MRLNFMNGGTTVATTGELCTIIEELQLVDIGDAASYLGAEYQVEGELLDVPIADNVDGSELMILCNTTASLLQED